MKNVAFVIKFVALIWVIEFVNSALNHWLGIFGIGARTGMGLLGILLAPALHGSFDHLISNTVPFVVLSFMIIAIDDRNFDTATIIIWLFTGAAVWFFSPKGSITIGLSGIVFGYLGFLLSRGLFTRRLVPILVSMATFWLYSWALPVMFPLTPQISWQGHLSGFIGGVIAALALKDEP